MRRRAIPGGQFHAIGPFPVETFLCRHSGPGHEEDGDDVEGDEDEERARDLSASHRIKPSKAPQGAAVARIYLSGAIYLPVAIFGAEPATVSPRSWPGREVRGGLTVERPMMESVDAALALLDAADAGDAAFEPALRTEFHK